MIDAIPKFEIPEVSVNKGPVTPDFMGVLACCRGDVMGIGICCNV